MHERMVPRIPLWSVVVSLLVLLGYCAVMGYLDRPLLAVTVVAVRLLAGYGIGFALGIVAGLAMATSRRGSFWVAFVNVGFLTGNAAVVVLAIYNLAGAN